MLQAFKIGISTFLAFLVCDLLWLGLIATQLYERNIGPLMRKVGGKMAPNWPGAMVVYLCLVLGVYFLVLPRADGSYSQALIWGALFGLVSYGIYDFTNYAILANWPLTITLIDLAWGVVLCAIASVVAIFVQNTLA